jgi:hypothetical protein
LIYFFFALAGAVCSVGGVGDAEMGVRVLGRAVMRNGRFGVEVRGLWTLVLVCVLVWTILHVVVVLEYFKWRCYTGAIRVRD